MLFCGTPFIAAITTDITSPSYLYSLRVIENRVLRRIFRPKTDEVIKGCRKLRNQEHHSLYSSPNVIRVIQLRKRWVANVACMGAKRKAYRVLVGKPEGKKPLRRPRHTWEGNIKVNLKEI
jgi:hypothetical protein